MRLLAQEGAAPSVPGGPLVQVAALVAVLTGMVTAVTAFFKVWWDRKRSAGVAAPSEGDVEAQKRILRETIEALGDALDDAAAARADAALWRDRYIRLLEGEREP